ncbi:MAG: DUF4235 domain-containing protein [Arcanobacterium sp.]|nr:DUF4235 domain-containing protein [Arcanobacterium sp.]
MNPLWKLITMGASVGAGIVAQKVLDAVWEKGLKQTKPAGDATDDDLPGLQVAVFAGVTAAVNAAVTTLVKRRVNKTYNRRHEA